LIDHRPWVSVLVTEDGPPIVVASYGQVTITSGNVTRGGTGNMAYVITFAGQTHPRGTAFVPMAVIRTGGSSSWASPSAHGIVTTKIEGGGTGMTVWFRHPTNINTAASGFTSQQFYMYTVP